ncbi:hypothetical protein NDU88_001589 [Pleurodeles waltl]|uniref:Uncharacterized protein n=1 Tax=Pleurodeles waltl TaxID=8319 RepID=A0AAV7KTA8_PLEWA|nr:hypothetical protein NDU88_001589 [Pleurodeles waltl]
MCSRADTTPLQTDPRDVQNSPPRALSYTLKSRHRTSTWESDLTRRKSRIRRARHRGVKVGQRRRTNRKKTEQEEKERRRQHRDQLFKKIYRSTTPHTTVPATSLEGRVFRRRFRGFVAHGLFWVVNI